MAVCQITQCRMTHRGRGQARSYGFYNVNVSLLTSAPGSRFEAV
jgi:hypothetical protein